MAKTKTIIVRKPWKCPLRAYNARGLKFNCGLTGFDCWEDCPLTEGDIIIKGDKNLVTNEVKD